MQPLWDDEIEKYSIDRKYRIASNQRDFPLHSLYACLTLLGVGPDIAKQVVALGAWSKLHGPEMNELTTTGEQLHLRYV